MFSLFLQGLIFLSACMASEDIFPRSPAQCKNHDGENVDWWFILQESGLRKRYLYFDSKMARVCDITGKSPRFIPLDDEFLLDDSETSPLIKTLYTSRPWLESDEYTDNTVMIAVNDQRGVGNRDLAKVESQLHHVAHQSKDPNAEIIRVAKGKDIFGNAITSKNAHAKYIFTTQAVPLTTSGKETTKLGNKVLVKSYLISHSLPRFPNFDTDSNGSMKLPQNERMVFGKNANTALSKGQHYFCQSFENVEKLHDGMLEYDPSKLEKYLTEGRHIISVYHLFKTINAAVVFSNFYNQEHFESMRVYHCLFDPRRKWSPNQSSCLLRGQDENIYPIGTCHPSLRKSVCKVWSVDGKRDPACITSFRLKTTDYQYQLEFNTVGHSGIVGMNMFDDIIAPQVIPKDDYSSKRKNGTPQKYTMDALIVQSWLDHTALGNNMKILTGKNDGLAVQAKLWITNSTSLKYPLRPSERNEETFIRQQSFGSNHSKLAFSVQLHGVGMRQPLFCFADKNRTLSQAGRSSAKPGRGGAAWCTRSGILQALMLSLHPAVFNNSIRSNVPISLIIDHIPEERKVENVAVMEYDSEGKRYAAAIPSRSHQNAFMVCAIRHPFCNELGSNETFRPDRAHFYALREAASEASESFESDVEDDDSNDLDYDENKSRKRKASPSLSPISIKRRRVSETPERFRAPLKTNSPSATPQSVYQPRCLDIFPRISLPETIKKLLVKWTPMSVRLIFDELAGEDVVFDAPVASVKRKLF